MYPLFFTRPGKKWSTAHSRQVPLHMEFKMAGLWELLVEIDSVYKKPLYKSLNRYQICATCFYFFSGKDIYRGTAFEVDQTRYYCKRFKVVAIVGVELHNFRGTCDLLKQLYFKLDILKRTANDWQNLIFHERKGKKGLKCFVNLTKLT